ncbi:hypothetical protein, partial [Bizionia sp.]|uniref:hypothetical protein n=1 Tax=Bizionia sp. TaxID=1954480 RepID=UPI003A8CCA28
SIKEIPIGDKYLKIVIVILAISLDIFNYFYYKHRYKLLVERFKRHQLNKKFKIWMLIFVGVGLLLIPFLYKYLLKSF